MSDEARETDHDEATATTLAIDDEVAAEVCARFDGRYLSSCGQAVVHVERTRFAEVAAYLRDHERFTMCVDVTAVDHLGGPARALPEPVSPERFEVVANYLSHVRNRRIRVIAQVPASDPRVPSITPIYAGANFAEREVFDLYGISFDGHPDLTRILMPDDWDGHPLRKDFGPARVPVTFKGDPSPR